MPPTVSTALTRGERAAGRGAGGAGAQAFAGRVRHWEKRWLEASQDAAGASSLRHWRSRRWVRTGASRPPALAAAGRRLTGGAETTTEAPAGPPEGIEVVRVARKRPRSPVRSSPPRAGKKGGEAGGLPTRRSMRNTNSRLNLSEENLAAAAAGTGALPSSASAPVLAQALPPAPKPGPAAMDVEAGPAGGAVAGATPAPAPAAGARAVAAPAGDPPPATG